MSKKRLDLLLQEQFAQHTRRYIQSLIMQGKAQVEGRIVTKPGMIIPEDAQLTLQAEEQKFVGRAGFKLEKALDHFAVDVAGLVIMDAGISTGGFTDCMLQRGARKVYGIDVGYGQVHEKVGNDERVVVIERTNLRNMTDLGEKVDLITLDLSFISLLKVMDAVCSILKPDGQLITLIKPQFEVRKEDVGRGGIIKDPKMHAHVIQLVTQGIARYGFVAIGVTESPIEGTTGNKEFLAYFKRTSA
ncbi:MAG: TlyA family RNA methyltransferase [Candidatus Dependentiae bacterium]|nr:TlyA family RNA methyltransferase [Candidatus Dependentiae bacterium]